MKRRKRKMKVGLFIVLGLSLMLSACSSTTEDSVDSNKIKVVTTIGQIAEPISIIGGDRVHVESLMGAGVDPHLYNATQGDIQKLGNGDVILYSGHHLEGKMGEIFEQISKTKPVLGVTVDIPEEKLLKDKAGAIDPHIWFDIDLWKQGLEAATEELKKISPEDAAYFETNKIAYFEQLDALKKETQDKLSQIPAEQRILVTAHDAFGYFGRMFDLKVVGLQGLSTEAEIGISNIQSTIDLLIEYQIPSVFVESSINKSSITAVIEGASSAGLDVKLGGELFSDAMGAEGTEEGTYIGMYRHNVEVIYHALTRKGE
jgi:manganese/zinc/iron transport system substrate-binding protein